MFYPFSVSDIITDTDNFIFSPNTNTGTLFNSCTFLLFKWSAGSPTL